MGGRSHKADQFSDQISDRCGGAAGIRPGGMELSFVAKLLNIIHESANPPFHIFYNPKLPLEIVCVDIRNLAFLEILIPYNISSMYQIHLCAV